MTRCGKCGGDGWTLEPAHHEECDPERGCHESCPVPVQEPCPACGGTGQVPEWGQDG